MNIFEWTRTIAFDCFIPHYTVNHYFLLINAKKRKNSAVIGKDMI